LDKEVEIQVPTLRLKLLNKLFDNYESNVEAQDNQREVADMQFNSIHLILYKKIIKFIARSNINVNSKRPERKNK